MAIQQRHPKAQQPFPNPITIALPGGPFYKFAVADGLSVMQPRVDYSLAHWDFDPAWVSPRPEGQTLTHWLTLMEQHHVAQLWQVRADVADLPVPTADELAEAHAAGWDVSVSRERPHAGVPSCVWIAATHERPHHHMGVRTIYFPQRDPGSPWDMTEMSFGTLARALARYADAVGALWYRSPSSTGARLMRESMTAHRYDLDAARDLPPCALHPTMLRDGALVWMREPSDAERTRRYIVSFDMNSAYLNAAGSLMLGVRAPHLCDAEQTVNAIERLGGWRRPPAGFYRVFLDDREARQLQYDDDALGLPGPLYGAQTPRPWDGKGWITHVMLAYLTEVGIRPQLLSAYVYGEQHRALEPFYTRLRDARTDLLQHIGRTNAPYAHAALTAFKTIYTAGFGLMGHSGEAEGWDRSDDALYRPDWYAAMRTDTRVRMHRRALKGRALSGVAPFAGSTDAWYYLTDMPVHELAARAGYGLGHGLGEWKATTYDLHQHPHLTKWLFDVSRRPAMRLGHLLIALNRIDNQDDNAEDE